MSYAVKEIYYTLQCEGAQAGRPAVFCRFTGCNLWSGREEDRSSAICQFCDTDFVGTDGPMGGQFHTAEELANTVWKAWRVQHVSTATPLVVCTGGEPLLQLDSPLVDALHDCGFEVAVETNGTRLPPPGIDWLCVSPKASADLRLTVGNELKLVFPQEGAEPELYEHLDFDCFYLQPKHGPETARYTQLAIQYCLMHPRWHLSVQRQKLLGIY